MSMIMLWIWLGVFVLALVIEAITQDLVSIWFSIGALVSLAISQFTEIYIQIIVFAVVSLAALIATRPVISKIMDRSIRKTNSDDYVGKKLKAITNITKFDGGDVKLNGIVYTAILLEDEENTIDADSIVEVVALKGNKLVVRKFNEKKENVECF